MNRPLLDPRTPDQIREKIREAVMRKPQAHCFETGNNVTEHRRMSQIGG